MHSSVHLYLFQETALLMKKIFALICCFMLVSQYILGGEKHYTVIVSLDGFRWDYPKMYDTPFLDQMEREGVKAMMQPSFPSKTFPNHYTLATGLVPDHHGIVANSFWDPVKKVRYSMGNPETRNDPYFYGGEPIWITAQKQGVKTGNIYWVGSDIAVKGQHPTYYKVYDDTPRLTYAERIAHALELLKKPEDERPQLIMLYIEEPDSHGHTYSPHSKETRWCISELDALMHQLWLGLQQLPFSEDINLIVTSDHGMATIAPERCVSITKHLKKEWYTLIDGDLPAQIYTPTAYRDSVYNAVKGLDHIKVWKREDIPAYLNYGSSNKVGDVIALPDLGWLVTDTPPRSKGAHGFDPTYDDMHVIFRAVGPDFKKGYVAPNFKNVCIYPLLAYLLNIQPEQTDGNLDDVKNMLTR